MTLLFQLKDATSDSSCRPACQSDAQALADLIVLASEGLCLDVWANLAGPGESPIEVGRRRAARDEGAFSWRNAIVVDEGRGPVAALVGYPLPDQPEPIPADMPSLFVPLQELENEACGTWYVNVLATFPEHRGQGHGSRLLRAAELAMRRAGRTSLSLIAAERNEGALRLYRRHGFVVRASRPAAAPHQGHWLLMTRAA